MKLKFAGSSHGINERSSFFFFFQAEDGIRDLTVTGVQTCALPISDNSTATATTRAAAPPAAPRAPDPDRIAPSSLQPGCAYHNGKGMEGTWNPCRQIGRASCRERV